MWHKLRMLITQTESKFGLKKDMKVKTFKHILLYWLIPVGTWCRSWWFFYKKFRLLKIRNLKWFWMFLKTKKLEAGENLPRKKETHCTWVGYLEEKILWDSGSHSQHRSKCSTVISLLFSLVRSCHWLFYRSHSIVL
jgi:hypothetical protein